MSYNEETLKYIEQHFASPFWRGAKWHIYASLEMLNGVSPVVRYRSTHWNDMNCSHIAAQDATDLTKEEVRQLFEYSANGDTLACRFYRQTFDALGYLPVTSQEKVLISCGIGVANKKGIDYIMQSGRESDDFIPANEWWGYLLQFRDSLSLQIQRYALDLDQLATKHMKPVEALCAYQVKSTEHLPIIREIEKRAAQLKSEEVIPDVPEPRNTVPGWHQQW